MSVEPFTTRVLSGRAIEWLEMLPPVLAGDPWVQAIFNAMGREMDRLVEQAEALAAGLIPAGATEETIAMWEALVGLAGGVDTSLEVRRQSMLARLVRGDGSGSQWERQMAEATGNAYRYTENDSGDPDVPWYTLRIETAPPTGVTIESLREYIRAITPANLHVDIVPTSTYLAERSTHATYTAARNAHPNYDGMRYG